MKTLDSKEFFSTKDKSVFDKKMIRFVIFNNDFLRPLMPRFLMNGRFLRPFAENYLGVDYKDGNMVNDILFPTK